MKNRVHGHLTNQSLKKNWSQHLRIVFGKEREGDCDGWPLFQGSSMGVAIGETRTQSCVSHWRYRKSSDESGRPLLRARVLLICREGCMASYTHKV